MEEKTFKEKRKYIRQAILCVSVGTFSGLVTYQLFLYFKLAIFGWNIGLIFAPLVAGYVETVLANRIIGENIGAISAFILFAYTTFYSFILKNTTLGFNLITVVSIAVILQAAFPTVVNYILFTAVLGVLLYILGFFKNVTGTIYNKLKKFVYRFILKKEIKEKPREDYNFDEVKSNEMLNDLEFIFSTATDVPTRITNLGQFQSTVIIEKVKMGTPPNPKQFEKKTLYNLKKGKDECLIKLVDKIKAAGGNGILDLDIQYGMVGIGGDQYQVTALGMGVHMSKKPKKKTK